MKKNFIVLVIIVLVAVGVWWLMSGTTSAPTTENSTTQATDIQQELGALDTGDIDSELQAIDQDISSL